MLHQEKSDNPVRNPQNDTSNTLEGAAFFCLHPNYRPSKITDHLKLPTIKNYLPSKITDHLKLPTI
jgi:hypothetical protein